MKKQLTSIFILITILTATAPALAQTDAVGDSWNSKTPLQVARGGLGVAVVDGKIYAIGGSTRTGPPSSPASIVGTNEEYDPVTDTWNFKTPMPTPRYSFAIATYQGKLYCIGGYTSNLSRTGVNEVYDPATNMWETKISMPTPRSDLQATIVDGKIYLIGGVVENKTSGSRYSTSPLNEVYDPATNTWTTKEPLPYMLPNYASATIDSKIYLIGGSLDGQHTALNQIYNTITDSWTIGSSAPTYFWSGYAVSTVGMFAPERIYVFNKPATNIASGPVPVYSNQIYDPLADNWTTGADIPTEREYFGAVNVNDTVYVIGGQTIYYPDLESWSSGPYVTPHATVEQYTPLGYGTISPSPSAPSNLENPQSVQTEFIAIIVIAIILSIASFFVIKGRKRTTSH
ncbi:MAG: kelch repeat-containing protein [Thermoproteota archaeon]|nr:kelch repeat-containing protein [Thermoproteota archaeon]